MEISRTSDFGGGVSAVYQQEENASGKGLCSSLGMSVELGEDFPVGAGARKGQGAGQECEAAFGNALGLWCLGELAQGQGRRG